MPVCLSQRQSLVNIGRSWDTDPGEGLLFHDIYITSSFFSIAILPETETIRHSILHVDLQKNSLQFIGSIVSSQVLDLSFNDFKGPGFEPLENCKALQVCVSRIFISELQWLGASWSYQCNRFLKCLLLYYTFSNYILLEIKSHHLQAFRSFQI